ncbi:hypothetical protein D3C72_2095740 [compost metagenome]
MDNAGNRRADIDPLQVLDQRDFLAAHLALPGLKVAQFRRHFGPHGLVDLDLLQADLLDAGLGRGDLRLELAELAVQPHRLALQREHLAE